MKNNLITGANGFIGYHLAEYLSRDQENQYTLIDNFSNSRKDDLFNELIKRKNINFIDIDLINYQEFTKLSKDFDIVYHFAAVNGTQNFYEVPFFTAASAGITTYNLLRYFAKTNVKKFIFASTSENYASGYELGIVTIPTSEKVPLCISDISNPRWSYAAGKIFSEALINSWVKEYNHKAQILRIHNIYGPRMGLKHVIPDFFQRCMNNDFRIFGANQSRSFLHIDDAIKMISFINKNIFTQTEVYNIGSNEEIMIKDLALKIMEICNKKGKLIEIEAPKGSVERRVPDISKIMALNPNFKFTPLMVGLDNFYKSDVLVK